MSLRATVAILSWNRKGALRTALQSVMKQSIFPAIEVVIVDNCSTDGTREMLRAEFSWVQLVERKENSGLAEGRNILVRLANAPLIFWMDDDCELVEQDCLEQLVSEMEIHPEYAVIYARIMETGVGHYYAPADVSMEQVELWHFYPATYSSGGTCVRKQQFLDLGGYDGDFFRMNVENAFSYRVFQAGCAICYYPAVTIIHRPHAFGRNVRVISFYNTRNKLLGIWRYLPLPAALVCTGLELPAAFCHALRSPARMIGFLHGVTAFAARLPRCLWCQRKPITPQAFSRWAYARHYVIRSLDEFRVLPTRYSYVRFALMELELGLRRRLGRPRSDPFFPSSIRAAHDMDKDNGLHYEKAEDMSR